MSLPDPIGKANEFRERTWEFPLGKPGVILELKTARKGRRMLTQALTEGLKQLNDNDYAADLRTAGVQHIREMVIACDGKRLKVLLKGAKVPKKKAAKGKSKGK